MRLKSSKIKRAAKHYMSMKAARKKLGLTGSSRHLRQLKRSINPRKILAADVPVSASSVGYQYNGRTISQLMGGN